MTLKFQFVRNIDFGDFLQESLKHRPMVGIPAMENPFRHKIDNKQCKRFKVTIKTGGTVKL